MSYDLSFWRQTPACLLHPIKVYDQLNDERDVEGLVELPIEEFLRRVLEAFPSARREPNGPSECLIWISEDNTRMFEVTWSNKHIRVDLRPLVADVANKLVDIASDFGCALFDPQRGERFAQPS